MMEICRKPQTSNEKNVLHIVIKDLLCISMHNYIKKTFITVSKKRKRFI